MRYLVTAAAAALMSASAAQAAVYQYDLTMELKYLALNNSFIYGEGSVPSYFQGFGVNACSERTVNGVDEFSCSGGYLHLTENYRENDQFDFISDTVTASIVLDSEEGSEFNDDGSFYSDFVKCSGASFICSRTPRYVVRYSASDDGFNIEYQANDLFFEVSSDGIQYLDGGGYSGFLGDVFFTDSGAGLSATYSTTSLAVTEIAPVPLPASFPLLALGIGGIFALRRRASAPHS